MGRIARMLHTPRHERGLKRKTDDDPGHPVRSQKYHLSSTKQPLATQQQVSSSKHNFIFRRKREENFDDGSYDLSAFFMFRDDPDAVDTLSTEDISKATTSYSKAMIQDHVIRLDFDPAISFDLGLDGHESSAAAENYLREPIFFRHESSASVVTTSFALERGNVESRGGDILNAKLFDLRQKISAKSSRKNPHNEYIADRYNTDRIQHGLDLLDMPPENDNPGLVKRIPLHKENSYIESWTEGGISLDAAVDKGSTIAGYSLRLDFDNKPIGGSDFEAVPSILTNEKNHVSFAYQMPELKMPQRSTPESNDEQNSDGYILQQEKQDPGVYIPAKASILKKDGRYPDVTWQPNKIFLVDDALSINNTLAVERFISAPRLCKGTKAVPSIVTVERTDDDDSILFSSPHVHDAIIEKESVFRPKEEDNDWKRVKSHMDQLPYIMKDLSGESEGNTLNGANSRGQSFGSPVGVEQFDKKRPWRKSNVILEIQEEANISKEEELIHQLKSRVERLISEAIPTDINIDKHNILLNGVAHSAHSSSVNELKTRLRRIQATHSKEETCDDTSRTHTSVSQIKARLRLIERDAGNGSNIVIVPVK
jgi:hypothetical protein